MLGKKRGQAELARLALRCTGGSMRYHFFLLTFIVGLMGCVGSIDHDEALAGRRAVEFAQVAFVRHDIERGYALLSASAKRYVSLEKFKETVSRLHPRAFPTSVTATEYEPMAGETAIYIFLTGENSGEHFYYRLTLEGTAATDYRVSTLDRGSGPYPPSNEKQKISQSPGTQSKNCVAK